MPCLMVTGGYRRRLPATRDTARATFVARRDPADSTRGSEGGFGPAHETGLALSPARYLGATRTGPSRRPTIHLQCIPRGVPRQIVTDSPVQPRHRHALCIERVLRQGRAFKRWTCRTRGSHAAIVDRRG